MADTARARHGKFSLWSDFCLAAAGDEEGGGYLAEEAPNVAISQRYNFAFPSQIRQIIKS